MARTPTRPAVRETCKDRNLEILIFSGIGNRAGLPRDTAHAATVGPISFNDSGKPRLRSSLRESRSLFRAS